MDVDSPDTLENINQPPVPQKAPKKSRNTAKKHDFLVDSGGDDGVEQRLQQNFQQAVEKRADMAGGVAKPEKRSLTLLGVTKALLDEGSNGPDFQAALEKLEKSDYRLYGIKVRCRGRKGKTGNEKGTVVARGGKRGEVVGFEAGKEDGRNCFEIRWSGGGPREVFSTLDVLCGAERHGGNDGVVSPLQNAQRAGLFLRGVFSMVNVQVRKYVIEDDLKVKRRRETTSLPPDTKKYIVRLRKRALEDIRETRATDTMSKYELDLLGESDEGLLEELGKDKSFFKLLGLDRFDETTTLGFIEEERTFHTRHMVFVDHFVRGAQSSWKLGRPTSLESCLAPISVGEVDGGELPEGVELESYET